MRTYISWKATKFDCSRSSRIYALARQPPPTFCEWNHDRVGDDHFSLWSHGIDYCCVWRKIEFSCQWRWNIFRSSYFDGWYFREKQHTRFYWWLNFLLFFFCTNWSIWSSISCYLTSFCFPCFLFFFYS